jgi:two-component system, chemotaxis family, response regulator Rcp1
MISQSRPIELLLVEDSSDDVLLIRTALQEGKVANNLNVVDTGDAALQYLQRQSPNGSGTLPDLVLLDLNLPGVDGRDVLAHIKNDPELRSIPVIVMTTSAEERDVVAAYDLQANAYVQKPLDLDEFIAAVRSLEEFWLSIVRLPTRINGH